MVDAVTLLGVALDYAAGGAAVLPLHTPTSDGCSCRRRGCGQVGKHPRTLHGKDDATTDPETVSRWWSMWPAANIGVRPSDGMAVLDVDLRNSGDAQLAAMQFRFGALPATRTARTGSGGLHLWFLHAGPAVGQLAPGIDVKGRSGYLVVPPSLHACGDRYEWTDPGPIAAAPAYLRSLLIPPPIRPSSGSGVVSPKVAEGLLRVVRQAPNGKRNARLFWAAARAVEKGIDVGPLLDAAVENGLPWREAVATVRSAAKAPPRGGTR